MKTFYQCIRSEATLELMKNPNEYILLSQIAYRAKRTCGLKINNLEIGESLIGDFKNIGLTRQKYRTALINLEEWGLITTKTTNKGTIAKIINSDIFDINVEADNHQDNQKLTNEQPSTNHQPTTNNNVKKEKNVKKKYKKFTPPKIEDVVKYFDEKGYTEAHAKKAFEYYNIADWCDAKGNKIKNWKQKFFAVWMKDEGKKSKQKQPPQPKTMTGKEIEEMNNRVY